MLLVCQALLLHQLQDLNRWELPCFHSTHVENVNGVFLEGGLCSRVAGATGINCLAAQPGFVVGAIISSG